MTAAEEVISYQLWFIQFTTLILILGATVIVSTRPAVRSKAAAEVLAAFARPVLSITAVGVVFSVEAKLSYAIVAGSGPIAEEALLSALGWLALIGGIALAVRLVAARSARRRSSSPDASGSSRGRWAL